MTDQLTLPLAQATANHDCVYALRICTDDDMCNRVVQWTVVDAIGAYQHQIRLLSRSQGASLRA